MDMVNYQLSKSSYEDSLRILKADIQHANTLAAAIPRAKSGTHIQMKLVYNHLAPLFLFLLHWMDSSCIRLLPRYLDLFHVLVYKVYVDGRSKISRRGRKATIREFYGVILPSLQRLHGSLGELDDDMETHIMMGSSAKKRVELDNRVGNTDFDREDECGICLEPCMKMVLPNCCHAMCIKCYRNWYGNSGSLVISLAFTCFAVLHSMLAFPIPNYRNTKSESCPFCRGSLKRVNSEDLWVLTCNDDVVDNKTVTQEDLLRFYFYINSLPKDCPDALFLVYYEYLI